MPGGNGYANACIGCAHFDALKNQSFLDGARQLVEWQRYSLAAAMYAYDNFLQIVNPCDDMVAFLKACAPIAYTDYGKAISHYGGLRIAPLQAVEYAGCGRAKQLAWGGAYDENGDLCYICYYDAGNSVYAGFMKAILTPEERRELYHGVTNPREELLGDTLELALGILTMAVRYPNHFINWKGSEDANACVRGIERSVWRYAAAEAIELLTADQPRKRSPPRLDETIEAYIRGITQGLNVTFEAVVDGDRETRYGQPTEEVSAAPPMPDETAVGESGQPEEEVEDESLNAAILEGIRAQVGDVVNFLETGKVKLGDREHTFCVACGSSRHSLRDCNTEFAPILENLQHMWWAIQQYPHPHHITFDRADDGRVINVSQRPADAEASMDVETGSAASSTTRRPKAKARPRQPTVLTEVMLIRYDNPRNLAMDVARRRGKFLACGVDIAEMGLVSQDAVGKLIEELADIRDRQLPQRGDLPKFATNVETGRYVIEGYSCIADHVRGGILDLMPLEGAQFIHRDWGEVKACRHRDLTRDVWKASWWALGRLQIDLRHHIGRVSGSTTLDGRDSVTLHDIIKCDEGGWVKIDELVRMDVLWSSNSRRITQAAAGYRDRNQRLKVYNERLQLIINGNILSAKKPDGKVRLQFLGIRVKEPPAGPYTLGAAGSNMMVSRANQITEIQRDPDLRCNQPWLGQSDGWVRPWAVRA